MRKRWLWRMFWTEEACRTAWASQCVSAIQIEPVLICWLLNHHIYIWGVDSTVCIIQQHHASQFHNHTRPPTAQAFGTAHINTTHKINNKQSSFVRPLWSLMKLPWSIQYNTKGKKAGSSWCTWRSLKNLKKRVSDIIPSALIHQNPFFLLMRK